MFLREMCCFSSDNSGAVWMKIFHLYGGWKRNQTDVGEVVRASTQIAKPPRRGFFKYKYRAIRKGSVYRCILIRARRANCRADGSVCYWTSNDLILMSKRKFLHSTKVFGFCFETVGMTKILTLFEENF